MWLGCRSRLSKCLRLVAGMLLAALSRLCPLRLRQRLRPICVSASWSRLGCKRPVCAGKVNDGRKDRLTCYWRCHASLVVAAASVAAGECGCQIISVSALLQGHCHGAALSSVAAHRGRRHSRIMPPLGGAPLWDVIQQGLGR